MSALAPIQAQSLPALVRSAAQKLASAESGAYIGVALSLRCVRALVRSEIEAATAKFIRPMPRSSARND